ncbi:MAG: PilZ domain-containing protein [Gemmataceae bacterium]|nr:PilZ domain-containing protein [Gemmataceae bacterium]
MMQVPRASALKSAAGKADRRTAHRAPSRIKLQARLSRATEEGVWMAAIRNISLEGIGLTVNRPVRAGMNLTVELPAPPPLISKPFLIQVTHARSQPNSQWWTVGGTFVRKLTKEELDNLKSRSPALIPQNERRTTARHTTRMKNACPLIRATEEGPWWATIRNVTMRGVGMISNRPFKPGTFVTVELPNKDGSLSKGRLLKVTHARVQPGNQWWVFGGVFLTKLTTDEVTALL